MKTVNINEAKTHLSRLIEDVASGEEVMIARSGKPVARLVPIPERASDRQPGQWWGAVRIGDDFDTPLPTDLAAAFGADA